MKDGTKKGRGGPRPNSGRKPLPADQKQSVRVMLTLTEREQQAAAEAAGEKPLGTYIREVFIRHLDRLRRRK